MSRQEHKKTNDESMKDSAFSGKGKTWLVILIMALLACIVIFFWLAKGIKDSSRKDRVFYKVKRPENYNVSSDVPLGVGTEEDKDVKDDVLKKVAGSIATSTEMIKEVFQTDFDSVTERGVVVKNDSNTSVVDPVKDDLVVRLDFFKSLANWLVNGYRYSAVKGHPGSIDVGLQDLNMYYGGKLVGISWSGDSISKGRMDVLRYVFTPDMLAALYKLYIDRFMNAIDGSLVSMYRNQKIKNVQKKEFYRLYAKQFRGVSGALKTISSIQNFSEQANRMNLAVQNALVAGDNYLILADSLGVEHRSPDDQKRIDAAAKEYQKALLQREELVNGFILRIRKNASTEVLSDSSIMYLVDWVDRRIKQNPKSMKAVAKASVILLDLAKRFEAKT